MFCGDVCVCNVWGCGVVVQKVEEVEVWDCRVTVVCVCVMCGDGEFYGRCGDVGEGSVGLYC